MTLGSDNLIRFASGVRVAQVDLQGAKVEGEIGVNGRIVGPLVASIFLRDDSIFQVMISPESNEKMPPIFSIWEESDNPLLALQKVIRRFLKIGYFFQNSQSKTIYKPIVETTEAGLKTAQFFQDHIAGMHFTATGNMHCHFLHPTQGLLMENDGPNYVGNESERL